MGLWQIINLQAVEVREEAKREETKRTCCRQGKSRPDSGLDEDHPHGRKCP